ncbi:pentapeptide repeat-containing protein [uncultured Bacteroides sp.]|uniref:pentapeptide repeat-containing protein n=1 Tax=uncultured Bacteroides sp. TaxID=162156 RepID=UPI00280C1622|nr:pentapeptide repeat-containing protein [uncultured Bacteroides sp.]
MRPNKPFVMPPVRIISPALEGQNESSKSLGEWLDTEETVRNRHFGKRTEEHMEYSYKSIANCTFSHIQFNTCKLKACHFTDVRFEYCDLSNISFDESSLFRLETRNNSSFYLLVR